MADEQMIAAQKDEAKQAKREAIDAKKSAKSEHDAAQAAKGEKRVKQPDDFSML